MTANPPLNPRTAHLARALYADLDYVLGVDPNTLAAFCVRVLDEWEAAAEPTYQLPGEPLPPIPTVRRVPPMDPDDSAYITKGG